MAYTCPVCGFPGLHEAPHDPGGGASDEICPSSGFQFGYDDDAQGNSYGQWRQQWVAGGRSWFSRGIPAPAGWDPAMQVRTVERPAAGMDS